MIFPSVLRKSPIQHKEKPETPGSMLRGLYVMSDTIRDTNISIK